MEITEEFFMNYMNGELTKKEVDSLTKEELKCLYKKYANREKRINKALGEVFSFKLLRDFFKKSKDKMKLRKVLKK